MNSKLLLLPLWFPFGHGEQFLETEIEYLCKAFSKAYVLPTSHLGSKQTLLRRMPDNAELLTEAAVQIQNQYERARLKRGVDWIRDPTYRGYASQEVTHIIKYGFKALKRLLGFLSSSYAIFETLKWLQSDWSGSSLLYSYWLSGGTLSGIALRETGFPVQVVSRVHGGDLYVRRYSPPYLPLHGYMALNVDKLFPISEHGQRYLQERYPLDSTRLVLSRLGVRKAPVLTHPSDDKLLHIVTCSYMAPVKRLALWIRALMLCQSPIQWTHIGTGPEESKLRELAKHLPDHIYWRFLGEMSNEQVLNYYEANAIDLFANVSESEGLPVSIMEALSFGIPVMATSAGGTAELVDERNGILLPVDTSAQELANALHKVMNLPMNVGENMRRAAVATWEDKVNAERQYTQFSEILLNMCLD